MNNALEIVGAVHTHTSQFLNKRNAIAISCGSAFCLADIYTRIVTSVFRFINYIEDS